MSIANLICSSCSHLTASVTCFCSYPLPLICPTCLPKHVLAHGFHFQQPLLVLDFINAGNFNAYQSWFFRLNRAQESLTSNLSVISQFEQSIESSFMSIENQISEIKKRYLSAFAVLKRDINTLISSAISETISKAAYQSPEFTETLSPWIYRHASNESEISPPLYDFSIDIASESEIQNLICVNVTGKVSNLPVFLENSARKRKISEPTHPIEALSDADDQLKAANEELESKIPRHIAPIEGFDLNTQCKTCGIAFVTENPLFHCNLQCECKECVVEAIVGKELPTCCHCGINYSTELRSLLAKCTKKCHVCGLVASQAEFEPAAKCDVCIYCMNIVDNIWGETQGQCYICKRESFPIDAMNSRMNKHNGISACCGKSSAGGLLLKCRHIVCGTHKETLKRCRKCKKERK